MVPFFWINFHTLFDHFLQILDMDLRPEEFDITANREGTPFLTCFE